MISDVANIAELSISDLAPLLNSSVTFKCRLLSVGQPPAQISWYHNGTELHDWANKTEVTVNSFSRSQSGQYSCRTRNEVGGDSRSATLTVRDRLPELGITFIFLTGSASLPNSRAGIIAPVKALLRRSYTSELLRSEF